MTTQPQPDTRPHDVLSDIEAFETRYGYDGAYLKEMLAAAPEALDLFNRFLPMAAHRQHASINVYFTAKITAFRYVDCGPCLQLAIRMAEEAGVAEPLLRDLLQPSSALPQTLSDVRAFTLAILQNGESQYRLRRTLEADIGRASLVEIGLCVASAQVFPVLKRATGHHQSCSRAPDHG